MTESLVRTHALGKTIGRKAILRDISVEVSPGSIAQRRWQKMDWLINKAAHMPLAMS